MKGPLWKKLLLPGLGGLLVGGAAVLVGRQRKKRRLSQPVAIPKRLKSLEIATEPQTTDYRGKAYRSVSHYLCRPTMFSVWSLLDPDGNSETGSKRRIFHVTPRLSLVPLDDSEDLQDLVEESFYATVQVLSGKVRLSEHLARGGLLELRKCYVGGSMNGVETGDRLLAATPIADFRWTEPER